MAYLKIPSAQKDAIAFARATIANGVRAAREVAGLTQAQLGKRMRRTAAVIGNVERGATTASKRHVEAVLRACGLPRNWKPRHRKEA